MGAGTKVDVAVIGAGTAGLAAYRAAVAAGRRAVVIEGGPHGTTCARVGCMPSKLLIAAAEAAHDARAAGLFGVEASVRVDGRAVLARVRAERDRFVGFVLRGVDAIPAADRVDGYARFAGPGTLEVAGREIEARAVVVATGSAPVVPAAFDGVRDRVLVNDDVFAWEELPESVAVFGGGVVGLELGQALHRLGARVRIFGRGGAIGPLTDPAVRAAALAAVAAEVPFDPDARVVAVRPATGGGVEVTWEDGAGSRVERFAALLVAAGRRPNLARLQLERAGVALDARGIPIFDRATLQVGAAPLFLAGDANDDVPLLHEAADEGRIAGENAARFPDVRPAPRRSLLAVVFSDPQLAVVGATFRDLDARHGTDLVAGAVDFGDQGRSRVMGKNRGLLRVYASRASGRLLGAEMAGPRAEHLAHLLAWAHQQRMGVDEMLAMPFYHPVVEEGLRTALREASARRKESS